MSPSLDFLDVTGGVSSTAPLVPHPLSSHPTDTDLIEAAKAIGCDVTAIQAVALVEAGPQGAFLPNGWPTCLFERHVFHRLTSGRFDLIAPDLSSPTPSFVDHSYGRYADQPERIARAAKLDRKAALRSASWGLYQIMGDNCIACGFSDVELFVAAMANSVSDHLKAFTAFTINDPRLRNAIRVHDWATWKRVYNGEAESDYAEKIAEAYSDLTTNHGG